MSRESIFKDLGAIGDRAREIHKEEGRSPINIAGPAGNPTQPGYPPAFCGSCGTDLAQGMPHSPTCPVWQKTKFESLQDYGDCCGLIGLEPVILEEILMAG